MKKINVIAGSYLDQTIDLLYDEADKTNEICFCEFNGKKIYSTDTVDEAYIKVLGKTKDEFEEGQRKWKDDYELAEREHQAKIPELTEKYRNEARGLVLNSELEYWDKIVPIRLADLYHGMELQQVIDCCKIMVDESLMLNERLKKAYKVFVKYRHSQKKCV